MQLQQQNFTHFFLFLKRQLTQKWFAHTHVSRNLYNFSFFFSKGQETVLVILFHAITMNGEAYNYHRFVSKPFMCYITSLQMFKNLFFESTIPLNAVQTQAGSDEAGILMVKAYSNDDVDFTAPRCYDEDRRQAV